MKCARCRRDRTVPDAVRMLQPRVERVEDDADGVEHSARRDPTRTRAGRAHSPSHQAPTTAPSHQQVDYDDRCGVVARPQSCSWLGDGGPRTQSSDQPHGHAG